MIVTTKIAKSYGRESARVDALRGMSFRISEGEFVAVMGPSGSGKSTLLAILGAMTTPTEGRVDVDGLDVYGLDPERRADFRREYLGFVFQHFHLIPYLTLLENVMLPLATKKIGRAEKREMALGALARVGLERLARRLPSEVSGGEQERAALARAVVNRPPILLADEPTGNLDRATSRDVMDMLGLFSGDGMTIVMVTHSPECAAHASRTLEMADGRLTRDGLSGRPALAAVGGRGLTV